MNDDIGFFPDVAPKFHAHLDACKQCRENPFDLCADGQRLIAEAAAKLSEQSFAEPLHRSKP